MRIPHTLASLLLLAIPLLAPAVATPGEPFQPLLGDWVGWAYLDSGGDLPLRLRIDTDAEGPRVRFDELVARRYDLPATLSWSPPRLVVERLRPDGSRILLEGNFDGGSVRGRFDWLGHHGDFELIQATEAISRVPPEGFADLVGTYRLSSDRSLVIGSRFWGELLLTDLATGRYATLFPIDTDSFFVGNALYVPDPAHAQLRFLRDQDGRAVAVEWREREGEILEGARTAFAEEDLTFESDGARLTGTLIRPEGTRSLPAAVVLGGSDWTDREGTRRDAEILASFGMATLIYDQRGHGASEGDEIVSFQQTARDAAAAMARLADREDVLPDQVGVTGRSRGGWIAPLAATLAPRAAFVLLFVPPAVSPADQETTRRLNLLTGDGASEGALRIARTMLENAWRYAASGDGWDAYAVARHEAEEAGLPEEVFEPGSPDDPEWEWTRLNMQYDPIPTLASLDVPLLALFGEKDENVVVSDNLPPMRAALERAGNRDFELFVVPGADHGLRLTPDPNLPPHRRVGFGSSGWPKVARWLRQRVDLGGSGR
jgi:hypothetical protein